MSPPTANPKIFHITHLENLASIASAGGLWSDARVQAGRAAPPGVGYAHIKQARMARAVRVAARGVVGDYVPFYFCPRSVMLYVLHRGHPGYDGGQRPIVHLVSDVATAVGLGRPWAFTDRNASVAYAGQYDDLADLDKIDWTVMPKRDWSSALIKEPRQAEFLVHDFFPWTAVREVGVIDATMKAAVEAALLGATHQPAVNVYPKWYY